MVPNEKIIFRDLPFDVEDLDILDYLYSCPDIHVKTRQVLHARMRDSNRELTPFYSGERFIYIKGGCKRALPVIADIGSYKCRISHPTQQRACKRCLYVGHSMYDTENCPGYCDNNDIVTIRSPKNVLCNYYPCTVKIYNQTFPSSEHAYQWKFCSHIGREDLAGEILDANTPAQAKEIASRVPYHLHGNWHSIKLEVMQEVLLAKYEGCPEFSQALIDSGPKKLVESVRADRYWSCGLNPTDAATTKERYYPGLNHLGRILESLRSYLMKLNTSDSQPVTRSVTKKTTAVTPSTHTNITAARDLESLPSVLSGAAAADHVSNSSSSSSSESSPADHEGTGEPSNTSCPSADADHNLCTSPLDPQGSPDPIIGLGSVDASTSLITVEEENGTPRSIEDTTAGGLIIENKKTVTKDKPAKVNRSKSSLIPNYKDNSTVITSFFKRKLSPEKEADTTNTFKLPRGDKDPK